MAVNLTKHAFAAFKSHEKPHSSVTDWVEILTSEKYKEEELDGIPELVDSINLQSGGTAEASRAIRKKLKHGNTHRQFRALVILKALVENGGEKFQTTFADERLLDVIRNTATDAGVDTRVRKKLLSILASWQRQFRDDPSMKTLAGLYKSCKAEKEFEQELIHGLILIDPKTIEREKQERKQKEKERHDAKKKLKEAERAKREEEEHVKRAKPRPPFDFEKEKPNILTAIANASQASNNLLNAITLVYTDQESVKADTRVQECLTKLKAIRKPVVRYIQQVENEELIGTLLETHERIIAALEVYDAASTTERAPATDSPVSPSGGELSKLQERQRAEVARSLTNLTSGNGRARVHPDLRDLNFQTEDDAGALQPPLQPSGRDSPLDDDYVRGTLSDFSDYESDGSEGSPSSAPGPSTKRHSHSGKTAYADLLDDEDEIDAKRDPKQGLLVEDPFADPFADGPAGKKKSA